MDQFQEDASQRSGRTVKVAVLRRALRRDTFVCRFLTKAIEIVQRAIDADNVGQLAVN